jgi:predicted transcriptional regulator
MEGKSMPETMTATKELDNRAMEIVLVALDHLGGVGDLMKRRQTRMLPALLESAYILVLSQEMKKSPEEIAEFLHIPHSAIQSVLKAPTEGLDERLRYVVDDMHEFEPHTDPAWTEMPSSGHLETEYLTGALAKTAYTHLRREEGDIKSWPG